MECLEQAGRARCGAFTELRDRLCQGDKNEQFLKELSREAQQWTCDGDWGGEGRAQGKSESKLCSGAGDGGGGFPHSHLHPAPLTTAGIITRMITAFEFSLQPNINVGTLHI